MSQPSAEASELSNEEKKTTEPAPVIVREDKRRYLYEGALIVLLALFLNELRNSWQESRQTKDIIENLRNELAKNKATVEGHSRYLTLVLHNIDSALAYEDYQAKLLAFEEDYFSVEVVAPEGIVNRGFIDDTAWVIAQENNIYSKVDFETISLLSEIYKQQAMINKGYDMVGEIIASREARDPAKVRETLSMILVVPSTESSNRRVLALSLEQIMPFYEYTTGKSPHDRLFLSPQGSDNLNNMIRKILHQIQEINPEVKHLQQIRQSVIAHWLKSRDVRVVQYMAGHKWVSSTERYQQTDLQDLQNKLAKHHPLQ